MKNKEGVIIKVEDTFSPFEVFNNNDVTQFTSNIFFFFNSGANSYL
jgi:hypothetical protein